MLDTHTQIISKTAKELIAYLDCPSQVFCDLVDDDPLVEAYEKALEEGKQEGYTPLLVVVDPVLLEAVEITMEDEDLPTEEYRKKTIKKALTVDLNQVMDEFKEELLEMEIDIESDIDMSQPLAFQDEINHFRSYWDYGTDRTKEVILAKIPTRNPWELPIYVPMGGFNDCPLPEAQSALAKKWYEAYGAIPSVVAYDQWEFTLPKPIENLEEAKSLAREHYAFCTDRIDQYAEDYDLNHLVYSLMHSTKWYFWWD